MSQFALLSPALIAAQPPQGDYRQVVAIAADSIATRLRAAGRAHFYIMPDVKCDSTMAACSNETSNLVREVFATSAIATVVQPGQRWPTLCDNSDEMRVEVPIFDADSVVVRSISAHALRRTARREALTHSLVMRQLLGKWSVVVYDTASIELEPMSTADAVRCAWSPESGDAVSVTDRTAAAARAAGGAATTIDTLESCPWCSITSSARLRLGTPTDAQLPAEKARVYSNGRGRYYAANSTGTQLLVFDATGALLAAVKGASGGTSAATTSAPRGRQEQFGSVDMVLADPQDSLFVLDNEQRRIFVFDTALTFARQVALPWRIDSFLILRDGRIVTVRTPRADGDPVSVHRATGEIIRSFGAPLNPDATPCTDCGTPHIALAPSGYRLWLAWSNRYRLEEWDLSGRRMGVLENPTRSFANSSAILIPAAANDPTPAPGINRLMLTTDGNMWVGYTLIDPQAGPVSMTDVLDPVRARLVKSFVGLTLRDVVSEGIRAAYRVDEYGLPEVRLERFQIDRRR